MLEHILSNWRFIWISTLSKVSLPKKKILRKNLFLQHFESLFAQGEISGDIIHEGNWNMCIRLSSSR